MRFRLAVRAAAILLMAVCMGAFIGCGPEYKVELRYDRPAKYEIPERIRILGIAEFGGQDKQDIEWGQIASDQLASMLDAYNRQFQRYQLVDRARLKAILDEQDVQAAFSDSTKAVEAGKIAHVDAMIYGSVKVTIRDEQYTDMVLDPLSRSMKPVQRTKRYVMAAVNFTIDDVETSKTLATVSVMREYDSQKEGSGKGAGGKMAKLVGLGGGGLPGADTVLTQLMEQCVAEFVSKISPHTVVMVEKLGKGKSDGVTTGNKLAAAGEYADALEVYNSAVAANPADYEAIFNTGVVYEAMGKLPDAEQCYDKAFKLKPNEQYVAARKRVRTENSNGS